MKPVLLLLPGMLNDAGVWQDVASLLEGPLEVRPLPCFTQESVPAMAQAAWEAAADLPLDVPLLLAGFSMGGYVALEMLARPRRKVAGAALVSTSARPETAEGAANREKAIAAMQADFAKAVDGVLRWATHEPAAPLQERLRTMMMGVGADTAIRQNRAIMARGDHRAALAALALPVEVACGRHDRITPPLLSQELAALVPGAGLHLLDGAGHMAPAEQPGAVAAVLRTLAARTGAAPATIHDEGDR